jgi:hypothetical protein
VKEFLAMLTSTQLLVAVADADPEIVVIVNGVYVTGLCNILHSARVSAE